MVQSIKSIDSGFFKLDGGAMFGVVPKTVWIKLNPPDDNNLCTWSLRCLLIETEDQKILVDCGIGEKQDARFRSYFEPHGDANLIDSLKEKSCLPEDITDVFLTHLHFDHCGGAVKKLENGSLVPSFPNATYWSNKKHWDWAMNPNEREKASFLKENFAPLMDHGVLKFIDSNKSYVEWLPGISVRYSNGHTEALMTLELDFNHRKYIYCSDLLPSSYHIALPYIMAYDIRPLVTLQEKEIMLQHAAEDQHIIIFEHDPGTAAVTVKYDDRGRIVLNERIAI